MAIPKFFFNPDAFETKPLEIRGLEKFKNGEVVTLSDDETRHASMARRLQTGTEVCLLDGIGGIAYGTFIELSKRIARVQLDKIEKHAPNKNALRIASAIPKGDRQKTMLDMLTQCGVAEFIPLNCEFSSVSATTKQLGKWHKIVIEACKQSGNPFALKIHAPIDINQLVQTVMWKNSNVYRAEQVSVSAQVFANSNRLAVIGPEGGFSDTEIKQMNAAGARLINLSQHILRTETACVAAATILNAC